MPRKDLAKAICEDGRRGSRDYMGGIKGFEKDHQFRNREDREEEYSDLEALPKRESMKYRLRGDWDGGRTFSENLAPIYGLIHKNVGKNWDKLYSEICKLAPPNGSNIFRHVHQHLKDYIAVNTQLCYDGTIQVNRWNGEWSSPEASGFDYYVHPKTRCIVHVKPSERVSPYTRYGAINWSGYNPTKLTDVCRITDDELYVKIYGIWYVYQLEEPRFETRKEWNAEHGCFVAVDYCVNKDRLSTDLTLMESKHNKLRASAGLKPETILWDKYLVEEAIRLHPHQNACKRKQASSDQLKKLGLANDIKELK